VLGLPEICRFGDPAHEAHGAWTEAHGVDGTH
jgi:hypothetical protein